LLNWNKFLFRLNFLYKDPSDDPILRKTYFLLWFCFCFCFLLWKLVSKQIQQHSATIPCELEWRQKAKSQKFVNTNFRKILCSIALTWSHGLRVIWSNIDWYVQIMIEYNGNNFFRLFLIGRTMGTLYWRLGVKDSKVR
jgi:hypothetical protein